MTIVTLTLIFINILLIGALFLAFSRVSRVYHEFKAFILPKDDGKPSDLANFTQLVADMVGRSICASLKSTFMGKESGQVRGENAVQSDLAKDGALGGGLASLISSFPSLGKSLKRNPGLIDLALNVMQKRGITQAPVEAKSNGKTQFELKL